MGIVARVKTLCGDVRRTPIRCSLEGQLSVVRSGIISVLRRVITNVILTIIEVHAVNPFPDIAP